MTPIETANKSEARKRKVVLIVIAVLAVLYLMPSPFAIIRHVMFQHRQEAVAKARLQAQGAKPSPFEPVASMAPVSNQPMPTSNSVNKLLGIWAGKEFMPNGDRGFCTMHLEVRNSENPAEAPYTAYASLGCSPRVMTGKTNPTEIVAGMSGLNPAATILLGTPKDDTIEFRVKQSIDASYGCSMTGATLTKFGTGGVAFSWKEDKCGGGQILLEKTTR